MTFWMEDYPWTVKVRGGIVDEVLFGNGTAVPIAETYSPPTIPDLFTTIQEAIDSGAHSIDVTYSNTHGYPMSITIDYNARLADEELYVTIAGYAELPSYDVQTVQDSLTAAGNLWDSYAIDLYSFNYHENCLICYSLNYPWTIQVSQEQARGVDSNGGDLASQTLATMPLFDVIQAALDSQAFDIQVTYHEGLGYPTSIYIDHDPRWYDDEFILEVSSLTVVHNPRAEFVMAEMQWYSTGYPSYSFTYEEFGFHAYEMAYPWVIDVVNQQISRINDSNGKPVTSIPTPPTIEHVFTIVQEALDIHADTVEVSYSKVHGFPTRVFIDYDKMMVDDERTIEISNFFYALH
jgi:Family of unknown function (DUF6174)